MEKKYSHKDFIGIYDNFLPEKYVDSLTNAFYNNIEKKDVSEYRETIFVDQKNKSGDKPTDNFTVLVEDRRIQPKAIPEKYWKYLNRILFDEVLNYYSHAYKLGFGQYIGLYETFLSGFMIQETKPSQGYHQWHCEWGMTLGKDIINKENIIEYIKRNNKEEYYKLESKVFPNDMIDETSMDRALVYTVYLNDIEEGGETEFLYQSQRVKPKKGRIVIFPASPTHVHRGNPPLSGTKLLVTGWLRMKPEFFNTVSS